MILSIDTESYGAVRGFPSQHHFHPVKCRVHDAVTRRDLVLTGAISFCRTVVSTPTLNLDLLASLTPGETVSESFDDPQYLRWYADQLQSASVLLGMNLPYDVMMLRARHPIFREILSARQTLIDLSILNFLHNELRPEKGLKELGLVLGTHQYDRTAKDQFDCIGKDLLDYGGQDTHNVVNAVRVLASRIRNDHPGTDKLSPECISHYSGVLWSVIRMGEAGVPLASAGLQRLWDLAERKRQIATRLLSSMFDIMIEGTGSKKSRDRFLQSLLSEAENSELCRECHVLDHPLLTRTEKKQEISFSSENRNLLSLFIPPSSPLRTALKLVDIHTFNTKLRSSYLMPILFHAKDDPSDHRHRAIPYGEVSICYPQWYVVPTHSKDTSSDSGGTLQSRITCKFPAIQTFPEEMKACITSRFPGGTFLWVDLSQIELRVAALLSGEPSLIQAFTDELDLHSNRAISIFSSPTLASRYGEDFLHNKAFRKKERQVGKTVNFSDLFRSGSRKMQATIMKDLGELFPLRLFDEVVANRRRERPVLMAWQDRLIREARVNAKIVLPFIGQSRRFRGGEDFEESEIINFPVQATAANVTLQIQTQCATRLPPLSARNPHILMCANVYDAIGFDCRRGSTEEARQIIHSSVEALVTNGYWAMLESHYGRKVPLRFEIQEQTTKR